MKKSARPSSFRQEGFAGQRLVVLPPPVVAQARRHPLLGGLLPTDAGFFPRASGHRVERNKGAEGFVVIVCLTGRGWYRSGRGGVARTVGPGAVLFFSPREPHAYGADLKHPWTIEWAHFVGTEAAAWREELGGSAFIPLDASEVNRVQLRRVHAALEGGYTSLNVLASTVALRASLTEIASRRTLVGAGRTARDAVAASLAQIDESLDRPVTLAEMAAGAGLSVSHYSALFRALTGYAPVDFLLRRRMQKAAEFLDTTNLRVEEIAARVGYEDAFYFSRLFKRFVGRSPRAYRAVKKG